MTLLHCLRVCGMVESTSLATGRFGGHLNRSFCCGAATLLVTALAVSSALAEPVPYDELPEGPPEELAAL